MLTKVITLWTCDAVVKDLVIHCEGKGFNSLYLQPIYMEVGCKSI